MPLKFYNSLTHKPQEFKSVHANEVRMYSCGPTVYNYVHIGNLRSYVFVDLLRRYIKYKGYKLLHVMNITDVDDKTIRDSQKEQKSLIEFTEFYTKEFLKDLETLNIQKPEIMPKATETIPEMIELIRLLEEKGYTYESNKDIYFRISNFKNYGVMANIDKDSLKKNAEGRLSDADEYSKEDARDFALWKAYEKNDGDVFWETEYGKGRPGWHIECSAMSKKFLGQPFDIHTGGVDLIFPHHTNEIAQSEAAYGVKFCNFFLHNEHLMVNGQKMSKSLGNFYTLRDLLKKGYKPMAIRYAFLSGHYRQQMNFTEDSLEQIPSILQKFYDFNNKLDEVINKQNSSKKNIAVESIIVKAKKEFEDSLDDDLNISGALAAIFEFMNEINKIMEQISSPEAMAVKDIMKKFDSVLGVMNQEKIDIPKKVVELAEKRITARKEKNWKESDILRDKIKEAGFIVEDTKDGYRLKKI